MPTAGGRGYQPMTAFWAEMNLVVADEKWARTVWM
jgi:hypothetical protein